MKPLTILFLGGLILCLTSTAIGGNTCSHRIIIKIIKRNEIVLGKSGNVLRWATDYGTKKITVGVKPKLKKLAVQVQAVNYLDKRTFNHILLTDVDKDFIPAIVKTTGQSNLKYFLLDKSNNRKKEIPQVTYTITDIF